MTTGSAPTTVGLVKRGLMLFVMLGLLLVAPVAAANAAVGGSTAAPSAVLYPDCRDLPVTYSIQPTPDVTHWNMDIDILAPDGTIEGGDFLSSFFDSPTGTFTVYVCGSAMPGTWTITGTGEYEGADDLTHTWQMTPSTFQVRRAHSRTTLKKKPAGRGTYSLRVSVKDERPNGYYPTDYPSVILQKLEGGRWRRVPGISVSVSDGHSAFRVNTKSLVKVRAVTSDGSNYEGSTSRPVTLRP